MHEGIILKFPYSILLVFTLLIPAAGFAEDEPSIDEMVGILEMSADDGNDKAMVMLAQYNMHRASKLDLEEEYSEVRTILAEATRLMSKAAKLGNTEAIEFMKGLNDNLDIAPNYTVDPWLSGFAQTASKRGDASIAAYIDKLPDGRKRIRFGFFNYLNNAQVQYLCDKSSSRTPVQTWRFDGIPMDVFTECTDSEKSRTYLGVVIDDDDAAQLVSILRRKHDEITVSAGAHVIPISAVGFTKAWNAVQ